MSYIFVSSFIILAWRIVLINAATDAPYNALRRYARRPDISQAVRLSIYAALGCARRKELRLFEPD